MITGKKRSLLVSLAAVLSLAASPAVAGFWANTKEEDAEPSAAVAVEEDHTVKLTHNTASSSSSGENEPVEYGVDVVSFEKLNYSCCLFKSTTAVTIEAAVHNNSLRIITAAAASVTY